MAHSALGLDLDGVLFDLMTPTCVAAYRDLGILLSPEDITQYDTAQVLLEHQRGPAADRLDVPALRRWCEAFWFRTPGTILNAPVHAPIWAAVLDFFLRRSGLVRVASARMTKGASVVDETRQALEACGLGLLTRGLDHAKTGAVQVLLEELNGDVVHVEDCLENALSLLRCFPTVRFSVWLVERPWNRDLEKPNDPRLHCGTEAEIAKRIRELQP